MAVQVHEGDATIVLAAALDFLRSRPVEHNTVWQILDEQSRIPRPGRAWWVVDGGDVRGVAVHTPLVARGWLTPMPRTVAYALADAIRPPLPGIMGDAAAAAAFAGQWATRHGVVARAVDVQRVLRCREVRPVPPSAGRLRRAAAADVSTVAELLREDRPKRPDSERAAMRIVANGEAWVWDDDGVVAMARAASPIGGVVRIFGVFTPELHRRRGYGTALVHALTSEMLRDRIETTLLVRLTNATANRIYRDIGYEPVHEVLSFACEAARKTPD